MEYGTLTDQKKSKVVKEVQIYQKRSKVFDN